MAKRKRYKQDDPGPNPDPKRYILVRTKEGSYWRLKRGLNKPAVLNSSLQQSADCTKVCSPAAKRITRVLWQNMRGLNTGRLIARSAALLKQAFQEKGIADFSFFDDFDFQPEHPLNGLLKAPYKCSEKDSIVQLQIPIEERSVKKHNPLVTEYYFDLVLLYGDATTLDGDVEIKFTRGQRTGGSSKALWNESGEA